jgi:hypothetical protein
MAYLFKILYTTLNISLFKIHQHAKIIYISKKFVNLYVKEKLHIII